jgi:hypothetical protein
MKKLLLVAILSFVHFNCFLIFDSYTPISMHRLKTKEQPLSNVSINCETNEIIRIKNDLSDLNDGKEVSNSQNKYLHLIKYTLESNKNIPMRFNDSRESSNIFCKILIEQNSMISTSLVMRNIFASLTLLLFPGKREMHDFISIEFYNKRGILIASYSNDVKYNVYVSILLPLYFYFDYEKKTEEIYQRILRDIFTKFTQGMPREG